MGVRHIRAIRGATTADSDEPEVIRAATRELLAQITTRNGLRPSDVISAVFTVTSDLTSEFPARAARELGWEATTPFVEGVRRYIEWLREPALEADAA